MDWKGIIKMDKQLKVYFAGPDVFRENPDEHFDKVKDLCDQYKITPLIPYNSQLVKSDSIYAYNVLLLSKCDVLVANITPFRGASVDPGTAFEIGYAKALNKPIVVYANYNSLDYKSRVTEDLLEYSSEFPYVENFGLCENLMIAHSFDFIYLGLKSAISSLGSLYNFLLD